MQINWFTLAAQIINFLILLFILKKLLYDRVVKAMDEREERIASDIREAEKKREKADQERQEFHQKKEDLNKKQDEILENARNQASERKKELIREAREEVHQLRSKWQRSLEDERESFINELRVKIGRQIYNVSRRVLGDLADTELEERIAARFADVLKEKQDDIKERAGQLSKENGNLMIFSSFEISSDARKDISNVLKKAGIKSDDIEFKQNSDLICGIEIDLSDLRISWSIDDYLESLQQEFEERIRARASESRRIKKQAEKEDKQKEPEMHEGEEVKEEKDEQEEDKEEKK